MKYWLILVLTAVLGAGAWLYHSDNRLIRNLPGEILPEQIHTNPEQEPDAADQHLAELTGSAGETLDISSADHFVKADQLLQFPVADQAVQAGSEEASSGYAIDLGGIGTNKNAGLKDSLPVPLPKEGLVRLSELLDQPQTVEPHIYFLHAVDQDDSQGLWGIVQGALSQTFAKGITLSPEVTLQTEIPADADERLTNQTSSFLGTLLNEKVRQTYIYNYRQGILGRNPDLIQPGQQLIIVSFTEPELRSVYNHFTGSKGDTRE